MKTHHASTPVDDEFLLPCPPSHLTSAILVTLFCCLPLGILSIVKANNVDSVYARSGHTAALQASEEARQWVIYSVIGGFIFLFLFILAEM